MDDVVAYKSWMKRNRIWCIPFSVVCVAVVILFFSLGLGGKLKDLGKAYSDNSLYKGAIEKVTLNTEAMEILGELKPTDKLAIFEGYVKYSDDDKEVRTTIRIKGAKSKGKLDIYAVRNGNEWKYKEIKIRVRGIKTPIMIVKNM